MPPICQGPVLPYSSMIINNTHLTSWGKLFRQHTTIQLAIQTALHVFAVKEDLHIL